MKYVVLRDLRTSLVFVALFDEELYHGHGLTWAPGLHLVSAGTWDGARASGQEDDTRLIQLFLSGFSQAGRAGLAERVTWS